MAFGSLDAGSDNEPLTEINMIPLIDVMLVLLVIFIVAAPLFTHAVGIDLPRASSAPVTTPPDTVELAIDSVGRLSWNGEAIGEDIFNERLIAAAAMNPKPELRLSADKNTPYEVLARVMSAAARQGLSRMGFVTVPE
ncbi:MAG: biopolymer transporter ExbD [Burkholderiales bacterium]|jgi:biopolymer transport protein ExbD|nr:biopolymer transporter ExbD [Burkholderiales bacterium]